ncbi:10369_t:CDS:2 [Acaulospora colombiana]|uniref:10369_t:CDS:1 n=1 Tax=Acaulospora colombiana TaxID=27376 RepID=A0ACA9N8F9_9GLOM|nr:10369_t:CDS:2 [Acaulospora colombiana]
MSSANIFEAVEMNFTADEFSGDLIGYIREKTKANSNRRSTSRKNSHENSPSTTANKKYSGSNSRFLAYSRVEEDEEELSTPIINIYREHRGHLEQDKKARTELDTQILKDDLYIPVRVEESQHSSTAARANSRSNQQSSPMSTQATRGINMGNFASFLPPVASKFLPLSATYNSVGINESGSRGFNDMWGYYHQNDMFTNEMDNIKGVCCS